MKSHSYAVIFCLIFLFTAVFGLSGSVFAVTTAWDNSADTTWYTADPDARTFEIDTPEELAGLAQIVNGTAEGIAADDFACDTITLTDDLNLGGIELLGVWSGPTWTPIGTSANAFAGIFDGNGKHITNLYINATESYQGLFGYTAKTAKIENLFIDSGYLTSTMSYIAAFVGYNQGAVLFSENRATVSGNGSYTGGISGNNDGYIIMCANAGEISSSGNYVGGITGRNGSSATVLQCYNTADISSSSESSSTYVGGVMGRNLSSIPVSQVYSTGAVTGNGTRVGGIAGYTGTYSDCFYLKTDTINVSLYSVGASSAPTSDVDGTAAKDVAGVQSADTLTALGDAYVADSGTVNNGYPIFSWQATGTYPDDETDGLDIASGPSDPTTTSFTVTMNKLLTYTTLAAANFTITATVNGDEYTIIPTAISQTNGDTATTVTFTFDSVLAEATVVYNVQYEGGDVFHSASFTAPASDYWTEYAARSFDGGSGTAADPYQIRTAAQLAYFDKTTDTYEESFFVLTADIDLSGKLWVPKNFNGCFDGQGHSISGLQVVQTSTWYAGFFAQLNGRSGYSTTYDYVSYVANLHLIEPEVSHSGTSSYVGAIAGKATDTSILNCSVEGGTISGRYVGGLVGYYDPTTYVGTSQVTGCSSTATIQGAGYCGGLIGYIQHGNSSYGSLLFQDCWTGGSVTGSYAGGLIGDVFLVQGLTIDHCFSTATISGTSYYVGGLVGYGNLSGQSSTYMGEDGVTITNSVALNPSVSTTSTSSSVLLGRIISNGDAMVEANKGNFSNNYAYELMELNGEYVAEDETTNGKNVSNTTSYSQNFWAETLGFDFDSTWTWSGDTNYPQLKTQVIEDVYAIGFTMQPQDATAYRTKTATFGVTATGGLLNYTYQWQYSTDEGETWTDMDDATMDVLSIGYQDGYASGTLFRCAVKDSSGNSATSDSAELTVVTSKYMPDDALKGIESYYETKGTLDTAGEAFALLTTTNDLSGYDLNLPAHYTYLGHNSSGSTDGYDVNDSFYFPWIMMDLYALGEDPQDYVVTSNGMNSDFNIIDFYLNTAQDAETGGFESIITSPGVIYTNEYAIPDIITGLEMYFDGKAWGNESDGTKLGRDGAIEYVFSLLQDDASGGKTFGTLRTDSSSSRSAYLTAASQRAQCEFVLLMVRLADDPVYGEEAVEAMHDVLKAMEAFYDDGNLTNTETGGYYVSALIGAASVTDGYFKRTAYLDLADEILKDIIAGSQSVDGGYSATIGTSTATADAHATVAMMMALSDYNNESAALADFTYTISDENCVKNDLAALSLDTTVTSDLTLPATGVYGSAITWATSDKKAITAAGKVTRSTSDVTVILTATAAKGEASQSKSFAVTVKADADAATDDVDAALAAISIPEETIADITVPGSTVDDVSFSWETSNSDVLTTDGTVTRPAQDSDDVTVTLTVTATKDSVTKTREFDVLVYAEDDGYMEAYHTGRTYYLINRDLDGYWEVFAAYALLGDYIQDPDNGYTVTLADADGSWYGSQYGATVLAICAMGENPYDYNGVNWVQRLKDNYGGAYAGNTFSQLAMVAAGADSSYYTASPSAGISMTKPENMTLGVDIAGWASEILALYAGQDEVDTAVADYIQFLQDKGVEESGNFTDVNCISTACVVAGLSALYAAGYTDADPTAETWINSTSGSSILDVLYDQFIVGGKYPNYIEQCYMAVGDAVSAKNGGTSAWVACGVTKAKLEEQIAQANAILENEDLYTEDSISALETALTAANNIGSDRLNAQIADYGEEYFNLLDAVKNVKTLSGTEQDENAAAAVTELINALPAADSITLNDQDDVTAARTAYDSLTEDQQALIDADVLAKLTAAEEAISALETDEEAANSVTALINALPETVTLDDEDDVTAARTAYDALSNTQKALISTDILAKLTAAEETIAQLEEENAKINDMTDVTSTAWYYDDVAYILGENIMMGTSATTFGPSNSMTRAQFVTILGRYAGIKDSSADNPATASFSDVKTTSYYAAHVAWAVEQGITSGTSSTTFSPNAKISRQDMAVMMARYAAAMNITLPDGSSESHFDDHDKISDYAKEAVYQMKAAGILVGNNNLFKPKNSALRSEAAAIMHRFITYAEANGSDDPGDDDPGNDDPGVDTVTFSVEKFTLGQGYIVEPMLVEIEDGDTVADVFDSVLTDLSIQYSSSTTDMGFYMSSIRDNDRSEATIPQYIIDEVGDNFNDGRQSTGWLGEFDYTEQSGWIYWVNNEAPDYSAGYYEVEDGDVIRWQFTVYGLGLDLGRDYNGQTAYINTADKDALTTAVATINTNNDTTAKGSDAYAAAITVLMNMESTQTEVDNALSALQ